MLTDCRVTGKTSSHYPERINVILKYVPYPQRLNLLTISVKWLFIRRTTARNSTLREFLDLLIGNSMLFIGEGNFSFVRSIYKLIPSLIENIIATSFEPSKDWAPVTLRNVADLRAKNVSVYGGVDGTKIDRRFPQHYFDVIIFQFPNVGSREGIRGRTSNFILIRRFLKSARICLKENGRILITAVNSPYYEGIFHFSEAAKDAGFEVSGPVPFDPADFPGYEHCNTNDDESAIEDYDRFGTWVFTPI
jgi:hypothetical protein